MQVVRFGVFELDPQAGELRKDGLKVRIQEQPFQILSLLVTHPGEVLTREDLRTTLWPKDTFVDFDHSLNTAINKLREALGDSAESPRFVATIPRRGYRFIAPVETPVGVAPSTPSESIKTRWPRERLLWIATLVTALAVIVLLWRQTRHSHEDLVQRFTISPRENISSVSIAPNGKHIAYVARADKGTRLKIHDFDRFDPREVPGSDGVADFPFWSADSQQIVFATGGRLWSVSLSGGQPIALCPVPNGFLGGAWDPNRDSVIFSVMRAGLYEVPARGGTPKLIVPVDLERWGDHYEHPSFLREADRLLLYTAQTRDRRHVTMLHSLPSGKRETVVGYGLSAYAATGHVLYPHQSAIWALPISAEAMKATAEAFPIGTYGTFPHLSVSDDGTRAYLDRDTQWELVRRDRRGQVLAESEVAGQMITALSMSVDNLKAVFSAYGPDAQSDLWIWDFSSRTQTRFTFSAAWEGEPIWHPAGDKIAFRSDQAGNWDIFTKAVDGSGSAVLLVGTPLDEAPEDWSPDGRFLVYRVIDPKTASDLWYLRRKADGRWESAPLIQTPFIEADAKFSPDGRFLSYVSNESGKPEVYVRQFPEGARYRVSQNGGRQPRWSRDGKELFYLAENALMSAPVSVEHGFSSGIPRLVFANPKLRPAEDYARKFVPSAYGLSFLFL